MLQAENMSPFPTTLLIIGAVTALVTLLFKHERRLYVWLLAMFGVGTLILQKGFYRLAAGDHSLLGVNRPQAWYQEIPFGLVVMCFAVCLALDSSPRAKSTEKPSWKWLARLRPNRRSGGKRYRPTL
jgi:hypothetical protein